MGSRKLTSVMPIGQGRNARGFVVGRTRYDSEVTRVAQLVKNIAHHYLRPSLPQGRCIANKRFTRSRVCSRVWYYRCSLQNAGNCTEVRI